jgi:hypothetical protein
VRFVTAVELAVLHQFGTRHTSGFEAWAPAGPGTKLALPPVVTFRILSEEATMVAPSLISLRRFTAPVRQRLQVAYARAWEALTDTHCREAIRFVQQLDGRLTAEEALHRYFREVAVPPLMRETVRARVIIELGTRGPAVEIEPDAPELWSYLRPDQLVEAVRRRARFVEETNVACQLAASVASEAVCVTHVENAREVAELLADELPVAEALMHYVRTFELPSVEAQMVFQRALASLAERRGPLGPAEVELPDLLPVVARPSRPVQVAAALGLRAIG